MSSKTNLGKSKVTTKKGRSKYLLPGLILLFGVILSGLIVLRSHRNKPMTSVIVGCNSAALKANFSCWQNRLSAIVDKRSPEAAVADLKLDAKDNAYVLSQCHQLIHRIGRAAAKKYPNVADAYSHGDNYCWSGYYHGVMETIAARLGYDGVVSKINTICQEVKTQQQYSFYHYNCVHGLGHGVMGITNNQLLDSLKICDKLDDSWEQQSCYGGTFMENVMSEDNPDHKTSFLKASEPMYPCTAVDTRYKGQCYLMQSSYALKLDGYDFAKVFPQCAAVDADFVATCYQSIGRDASGNTNSDVTRTNANCMVAPDEVAQSNCVIGAVKDFISYYHSDVQGKRLCASFDSQSLKDICTSTALEYYKTF
jgi:hypothetical protein